MALPKGKHCYYRPNRTEPRKVKPSDAGRFVLYARNAGATDEAVCLAIREKNPDLDCCGGDCDCERLAIVVSLAAGVVALGLLRLGKRREATRMAQEAIAKAIESSKGVGKIELEKVSGFLTAIEAEDDATDEEFQKLLDVLRDTEQNAFAAKEKGITITEPKK